MKREHICCLITIALLAVLVLIVVLPNRQPAQPPEPTTASTVPQTAPPTTLPVDREGSTIGICLPSQAEAWSETAHLLKQQLTDKGYAVELSYGDGTPFGQLNALNALFMQNVDCVIVAPADSATLPNNQLVPGEDPVPLISYGSLLMDTDTVAGYVCYDYYQMGREIARKVEDALDLSAAADQNRSHTIELFMGAPKDYNAVLLYDGLQSILGTYLDSGVLECKSGRLAFEDNCISGWSADAAATACATRLKNHYPGSAPDICITGSDNIAAGVIRALKSAGVHAGQWPLITGNGATEEGLTQLSEGELKLTVSTDPTDPAKACVAMVDMVLFGVQPDFPVAEISNHLRAVPTALCDFQLVCE